MGRSACFLINLQIWQPQPHRITKHHTVAQTRLQTQLQNTYNIVILCAVATTKKQQTKLA